MKRLVGSGVRGKIAMLITGHKTRSVFDRYHIGNDNDLEQAAKLLEPGQQVSVSENDENRHIKFCPLVGCRKAGVAHW